MERYFPTCPTCGHRFKSDNIIVKCPMCGYENLEFGSSDIARNSIWRELLAKEVKTEKDKKGKRSGKQKTP